MIGKTGFDTLSGLRAYVASESLWAKGQKDATYNLRRYAATKDEDYYNQFLKRLSVIFGFKKARLELEKPNSDMQIVHQGFAAGGSHPDDFENMAWIYKKFRNLDLMDKAIGTWVHADDLILKLQVMGAILDGHLSKGDISQETLDEFNTALNAIEKELSAAEENFSDTIGEACRWAASLLLTVMIVFTIVGGAICVVLLLFVGKIISSMRLYSKELEEKAAAEREALEKLAQKAQEERETKLYLEETISQYVAFVEKVGQ
ncbi:MAG: hypothetical protein KKC78_16165, partial [Proteobacteria bacterium]|nr:hypothetical protein [Pseudomonadota bacterium]